MTRPLLGLAALAAGIALGAAPAKAQLLLAPPALRLPPAPPIAGAPAPLRFRAPWELPAPERRAAAPDTARSRRPAVPGACGMPVFADVGGDRQDQMPVFRPDTATAAPPMPVLPLEACAPAT